MRAARKLPFVVFAFVTTHAALCAESLLAGAGLDVVPVPTPAGIGGMCGIAMRIPPSQAARARDILAVGGVEPSGEMEISDLVRD